MMWRDKIIEFVTSLENMEHNIKKKVFVNFNSCKICHNNVVITASNHRAETTAVDKNIAKSDVCMNKNNVNNLVPLS